jgi:hypothetical protein
MAFEEFKAKKIQMTSPYAAILKSGSISLNTACCDEYFKDVSHIIFLYDRERKTIGIRPAQKELANSYAIRKNRPTGGGGSVAASAFLKSFVKIDCEKHGTKQYEVSWNGEENLLEVYLDRPIKK